MKQRVTKIDKDTAARIVLFPYALAAIFLAGYFCFLFFVFSGVVELKDPTVSGLVGAILQGLTSICLLIVGYYFGKQDKEPATYDVNDPEDATPTPPAPPVQLDLPLPKQ